MIGRIRIFALVGALSAACASSSSAQMNLDELAYRGGLYVDPASGQPYNGEVVSRWNAQVIRERGTLRHGHWNGLHEWYHRNGQLSGRETYRDGVLDGEAVAYYKTGQLSARESYRSGRLDGPYESYWVRGILAERGAWSSGEPCGEWVSFGRPVAYPDCPAQ